LAACAISGTEISEWLNPKWLIENYVNVGACVGKHNQIKAENRFTPEMPGFSLSEMNMTRAYELKPDQTRWGRLNSVEATHARKLPGVHCPSCGATWATTGILYPSVDMAGLAGITIPAKPWPIPIEEFKSLAASVQQVLGAARPVRPGTDLGPLRGKAQGSFGDFAWVNSWTPLLRESVWLALRAVGIELVGIRAEIRFRKRCMNHSLSLKPSQESHFRTNSFPRSVPSVGG